jgi:hypothetical protein
LPEDLPHDLDVVFDPCCAFRWRDWRVLLTPGGVFVTTLPSAAFAVDKLASLLSSTKVRFIGVKARAADLRLLGSWLEQGLPVPVASTIPVRDLAKGLAHLQRAGGRVSVHVANSF